MSDFLSPCIPKNTANLDLDEEIVPISFQIKECGTALFMALALFLFEDEKAHKLI